MANSEKIQGETITRIIEGLVQDKTLVEFRLPDKDYQCLTLVTAIRQRKEISYFQIEDAQELRQALADIDLERIHCEFTGKDRVKYFFRTKGGEIAGDRIWIKFPAVLERRQRRKLFRLNAPAGTKLCFSSDSSCYEMEVVNISLGGLFCRLAAGPSRARQTPLFAVGTVWENIELMFPMANDTRKVCIRQSQIERVEKKPHTHKHGYGLEFIDIDRSQEKILTEIIYAFQRKFLRNRLPVDA
ncbi:MAG: PilZ domain-containing protein [Desulfobacterales bacterium]|nr:MAG: PilZ domain-containing protein [Desulfobacterales bacterium]